MVKDTKTDRSSPTGKLETHPIGTTKARKFAAVEGMTLNAASEALAKTLTAKGLTGDAYRAEVSKVFKKGKL